MNWIPVEKELPRYGQTVLVSIWEDQSYGRGIDIRVAVDMADYLPNMDGTGAFRTYNNWFEGQPWDINAWMPLPEPYREEEK